MSENSYFKLPEWSYNICAWYMAVRFNYSIVIFCSEFAIVVIIATVSIIVFSIYHESLWSGTTCLIFIFIFQNSYSRYNLTLLPDDTVNRILLGQPYSLECYRSHEDKIALVDTALETMDGSAILATLLHLKNTVKKSLFVKVKTTCTLPELNYQWCVGLRCQSNKTPLIRFESSEVTGRLTGMSLSQISIIGWDTCSLVSTCP